MRKLQNRLILVIVTGILLATFICGAISLFSFVSVNGERSISLLNKELKLSASYFNETFVDVEKFTHTLSDYYLKNCPAPSELTGAEGTQYMNVCKELAMTLIKDNEILCATYFRLNPELVGSGTGGYFLSATSENHSVTEQPPTDILAYDPEDISHVGWYYVPVKAGESVWMDEYFNENNGILMISYVSPLFLEDGTLLGVVGIDIDMTKVYSRVAAVKLYDTGFEAIMSDKGEIKNAVKNISLTDEEKAQILSSDTSIQLRYLDRQKEMTLLTEKLENGDYLLLAIQDDDLYETESRIVITIVLITLFVSSLIIWALTELLYKIFRNFKTDSMTKTENRNAYSDEISEINSLLRSGRNIALTVLVFDVNGLKQTNDQLGHDMGDALLQNAAQTIRDHFPNMVVYRIGGDEFAICCRHSVKHSLSYQFEKFRNAMREQMHNYDCASGKVVISSGMATYDASADHCYEDVFRRADHDMYHDKRYFYQINPHLNRRSR